jgi:hypothetical protein
LNLPVFLSKYQVMKTYGRVEVYFHTFLISALNGNKWSASGSGRFTPRERVPGTHWIGPQSRSGCCGEEETLSLWVKQPGREADHSYPSSAVVKECVVLYLHSPNTSSWRGAELKKKEHRNNFTFYLCLESKPGGQIRSLVTVLTELSRYLLPIGPTMVIICIVERF